MRREDKLWGGYSLLQDDRFFKLGQDSILLSDFAAPPAGGQVLDLGCGNGALCVLLCARFARLKVTGLEIQPELVQLARENAEHNRIADRMTVVEGDLKQHKKLFENRKFDYIICNPPYFVQGSGYSADGAQRRGAREEEHCTMEDAIRAAGFLVKFGGRAAFVHRPERLAESMAAFRAAGLEPKRLRFVHQRASAVPSVVLIEARKGSAPGLSVLPPLLVCREDGSHTDEYRSIYHKDEYET